MRDAAGLIIDCKCDLCKDDISAREMSIIRYPDGNLGLRIREKKNGNIVGSFTLSPADVLELAVFAGIIKEETA